MKMCLFALVTGALVGGLALFSAAGSRGEKPREKGATNSPNTDRSTTNGVGGAQEVEAFFDELIPRQLEELHLPGATVSVVRDGTILFAKGYGWTDIVQRVPVAADRSLFHIGSNTKLFTWTALMQLLEEGKLDLDADVSTTAPTSTLASTNPTTLGAPTPRWRKYGASWVRATGTSSILTTGRWKWA